MDGPTHYLRAEKHLAWAAENTVDDPDAATYHLHAAHVHQGLALIAATIAADPAGTVAEASLEWATVTGIEMGARMR